MRERPDGIRLLELAREVLLEELLPALPPEFGYSARLAANAIAIAAREMESGDAPRETERLALERLLGEDREASPSLARAETLDEATRRLSWRLSAEIRAGGRDADPTVFAALTESARASLEIVNPRGLRDKSGDA